MTIIIKKPIITEKSLKSAQKKIYTFLVEKTATKKIIKQSIEKMFGVHVVKINTVNKKGKKRLVGKRKTPVYESSTKKAKVILQKNEKIDLFDVGGEK